MKYKDLSQKMRPKTLDGVFGNQDAKKILLSKNASSIPKAILISGAPGCSKTTLARIIMYDILKGSEECVDEINMGTDGGINTARKIEEEIYYQPGVGPINGWIIDECHKAEKKTISALLKPTEDSPDFNYFIFCTSDRNEFLKKITPTEQKAFLRRCTEIKVSPISDNDGFDMLSDCLEGLDVPQDKVTDDVVEEILKISEGIPGVMYKNLERVISFNSPEEMIEDLKKIGLETSEDSTPEMKKLWTAILQSRWDICRDCLSEIKQAKIDVESFRYPMMGYMLSVMLSPNVNEAVAEKAVYCIEKLEKPLHEGRIYKFSTIVRTACFIGKQK